MKSLRCLLLSALAIALPCCYSQAQTPTAGSVGFTVKNSGAGSSLVWSSPVTPPSVFGVAVGGAVSNFPLDAETLGVVDGNLTVLGGGGGGTWGSITGTLSAQTDLAAALAAKAPLASPTFTGTVTGNGSGLTSLNASNLGSGTVATARLGTGTANSMTFLRGDNTWATPGGGGDVTGPASSLDGYFVMFDGTTGKLLKSSTLTEANFETVVVDIDDIKNGTLAQFAATTSAQLRGIISDESGTGPLVFADGHIGDATGESLTLTGVMAGAAVTAINGVLIGIDGAEYHLLTTAATAARSVIYPDKGGYVPLVASTSGLVSLASEITGTLPIANGGTNATSASAARTSLGLAIGSDVQAYDADLADLADGTLSGSKVGTGINAANITTGTLAIANGGTNASSASAARTNLGLVIGTDVLAPNGSGASLTSLNASNLGSGTVATARLGTGTANSTTFLRGDNTWATPGGSGDVVGPASSTDNALPRFDSTTGKLLQGSGITVDDSGNISMVDSTTLFRTGDGPFIAESTSPSGPSARWNGLYFEVVRYNGGNSAGVSAFQYDVGAERDILLTRTAASSMEITNGSTGFAAVDALSYQLSGGSIILSGSGSPESAVTAPIGSLFLRTNGSTGTTLYIKESGTGNTGWIAAGAGGGSGITALTGDVTASGTGSVAATLANTAVTPGTYAIMGGTVDAKGRLTDASENAVNVAEGLVTMRPDDFDASRYGIQFFYNQAYPDPPDPDFESAWLVNDGGTDGRRIRLPRGDGRLLLVPAAGDGDDGDVLTSNGDGTTSWDTVTGTGTVTSVTLSVPTGFTGGGTITTSGTFPLAYDTGYVGYTTTEQTKLSGIEAAADVTDATNVAAAGAVMEADTSTASMSFVVDEDAMTSNSATKVPTQQSVKAYVDGRPDYLQVAISNETDAVTVGTAKLSFQAPVDMNLTSFRAEAVTAPTGSTLVVDINEAGTTVLSTKLSIDATERTSNTAATAAVISDTFIAKDAWVTIDLDQVGSTIAGAGIKITFYFTH